MNERVKDVLRQVIDAASVYENQLKDEFLNTKQAAQIAKAKYEEQKETVDAIKAHLETLNGVTDDPVIPQE